MVPTVGCSLVPISHWQTVANWANQVNFLSWNFFDKLFRVLVLFYVDDASFHNCVQCDSEKCVPNLWPLICYGWSKKLLICCDSTSSCWRRHGSQQKWANMDSSGGGCGLKWVNPAFGFLENLYLWRSECITFLDFFKLVYLPIYCIWNDFFRGVVRCWKN